jgi:hypothetical protein
MRQRGWWAAPLLSRATQAGQRVIVVARQWAARVAKPVRMWMSDKQEACVKAIAMESPGTPPRYCHNHLLRDLATPVLERASQAKVKRRRRVRGVRASARRVVADRRHGAASEPPRPQETPKTAATPRAEASAVAPPAPGVSSAQGVVCPNSACEAVGSTAAEAPPVEDEGGAVVRGYCAAVRGIRNDDQGSPLHPPGLRLRRGIAGRAGRAGAHPAHENRGPTAPLVTRLAVLTTDSRAHVSR